VGATEKADQQYTDADFRLPVAIIMGSEEYGISIPVQKMLDEDVRIPLTGNIASLNVSVAAGIVLFEIVRQRTVVKP